MHIRIIGAAALAVALGASHAAAQVVADTGYIYSSLLLSDLTQSCVQTAPNGTFVGRGPGFTGAGQSVVLVSEDGTENVVATGFNSIGDCEYDAVTDTLYVSDNALEASGSATGDTVFAIGAAATAPAETALGNELIPAGSLAFAQSLALDAGGTIHVSNAAGSNNGSVQRITGGSLVPVVASGLDFVSGITFDTTGELLVAETLDTFDVQVARYSDAGAFVELVAGPGFGFGTYDINLNVDGEYLVTGAFAGDIVSMDATGATTPFAGGLTFATGVDVDAFTGRVTVLSSTFVPTDEDRSLHRFVAKDRLVPGTGSTKTECTSEVYGLELVPAKPGKPAKHAICVDGEPCDADGVANDVCTFPVGFCVSVSDPRFTDCTPSGMTGFSLVKSKPESAALSALTATVDAAAPLTAESCFFSDGVQVPVKITGGGTKKDGKGKFKVQALGGGTKPPKDTDSVKLVCRPPSP